MAVKLMPVAPVNDLSQPAGEPKEQQPRIPRKKRRSIVFDADGNEVLITLKCVHCNRMHPLSNFGLRKMADGAIRNQPWCRECRGASTPKKKKPVEQAGTPIPMAVEVVPVAPPAPSAPAVHSGPLQVVPLTAEQALAQFRALAPQLPVAEPAVIDAPTISPEPPKPE